MFQRSSRFLLSGRKQRVDETGEAENKTKGHARNFKVQVYESAKLSILLQNIARRVACDREHHVYIQSWTIKIRTSWR